MKKAGAPVSIPGVPYRAGGDRMFVCYFRNLDFRLTVFDDGELEIVPR